MKKLIVLVLVFLFLFGCISGSVVEEELSEGESSGSKSDFVEGENKLGNNVSTNEGGVFCRWGSEYKLSYEENNYFFDKNQLTLLVTMKRYFKKNSEEYLYFEKLSENPGGVGTWSIANEEECIVYSTVNGGCNAFRHSNKFNPFLRDEVIYYSDEFTGETKKIGGSEIGWELKQEYDATSGRNSMFLNIVNYISKEYCIPLTHEIYALENNIVDGINYTEKVNFSREFSDSVFELPIECKDVPIIDLSEGYFVEEDYDYEGWGEYSTDYGGEEDYSNSCLNRCVEQRIICDELGLSVTQDGLGCYDSSEEYQRSCECVCLSD